MKIKINGYMTLLDGQDVDIFDAVITSKGWRFKGQLENVSSDYEDKDSSMAEPYLLVRGDDDPQVVYLNRPQVQLIDALGRWDIELDSYSRLIPLCDLETLSI